MVLCCIGDCGLDENGQYRYVCRATNSRRVVPSYSFGHFSSHIDPLFEFKHTTEAYYSFGQRGIIPGLSNAMWPALDKLDNQPDWDWSQFDLDEDGQLDSVVMMHSGIDGVVTPGTLDVHYI